MTKSKNTITYKPDQIPARTFWRIQTDIPREDVVRLCEGLRYMMTELRGATFYYPNLNLRKTTCRYEWHVKSGGKRFAVKLGIHFNVDDCSLTNIEAYAAHGHDHPAGQAVPNFNKRQAYTYQQKVAKVLKEAVARRAPDKGKPYHVVYFIEPPPFNGVEESISLREYGLIILPTVIVGRENKRVSAVIHTVQASFLAEARELAFERHMMLCSLLTLARGLPFITAWVKWPSGKKPTESLESVDPLPDHASVYPASKWRLSGDPCDKDFGRRLEKVLGLYYLLPTIAQKNLADPILAYYAGKEIQGKQPTLAIVAFLAALSSMTKPVKCPGEVHCSKCGPLEYEGGQPFQHNKVGDREAIVAFVSKVFQTEHSTEAYKQIEECIARSYSQQRSAFVHGAILRHAECHQQGMAVASQPTHRAPYSGALLYRHDLYAMDYIARKALLIVLAGDAPIAIDEELFDLRRKEFRPSIEIAMCITLPARTPVGIIGPPTGQQEERA